MLSKKVLELTSQTPNVRFLSRFKERDAGDTLLTETPKPPTSTPEPENSRIQETPEISQLCPETPDGTVNGIVYP